MKIQRAPVYFNILIQYLLGAVRFKIFGMRKKPSIVIHLVRRDMGHEGRWLYLLLHFLSYKQESAALVRNIWNFREYYLLGKYGRLIFGITNLSFQNKVPFPRKDVILVSDFLYPEEERKKWSKFIYIDYDLGKSRESLANKNYIVLNPRMHPFSYAHYSLLDFEFLRRREKKIKVFFSGNTDKKAYSQNQLTEKFNIVPRYNLIQSLKNLSRDKILLIDNIDTLNKFYKNGCKDKFVLDDNRLVSNNMWLLTLSSSDFFLCPPASHMPFSHNAFEAMAVGAIPLINYPDWFDPPLKNGINCITFSDADDLAKKIEKVLSMEEDEISKMRKDVLEYYEKFLSPDSFYKSINQNPHKELTLFYNVEDVSILPKITGDSVVFG